MTSLTTLVQDMNRLESELRDFEVRFGVKSPEFCSAMVHGDLDDFDALDEYRMEFIKWLALFKTWTSLDEKYRQLVSRQPIGVQLKANLQLAYG